MTRAFRILLPLLAILAVGTMQVFGLQMGFLCGHNNEVREVEAEHCHLSPASNNFIPCETQKQDCETSSSNTEHHTPVSVEIKTNVTTVASVSAPVYVPVLALDNFFEIEWFSVEAHAEATAEAYTRESGFDKTLLSTAVQTAKCMVLLV